MVETSILKQEIMLEGLNCAHCAETINKKVSELENIKKSNLNFITKKLTFEIEMNDEVNSEKITKNIIDLINSIEPGLNIKLLNSSYQNKPTKTRELTLNGLNCAHCAGEIEKALNELEGIQSATLNFMTKKLIIEIADKENEDAILKNTLDTIKNIEYGIEVEVDCKGSACDCGKRKNSKLEILKSDMNKKSIPILISFLLCIISIFLQNKGFNSTLINVGIITAYIIVGKDVILKAFKNLKNGRIFDENFLMTISTMGAFIINEKFEAVGVMLFYQIGECLQELAVGKSRKSISDLMQIKPDVANLKIGENIKAVSPEDIQIGDFILVKPGERIPLDGIVTEGISMVDTSTLTGEAVLREISVGDEALSGMINKNSILTIQVSKEFKESTVSKILDLVENAANKKSKTENFISQFAKYYTPAVLISALVISIVPPLILKEAVFIDWLYRGLVFLVVSCPCALVLSVPLSFFSGIGKASKQGVLIKGSNYLEALNHVDTVVFDKTGTLTQGVFEIDKINAISMPEETLLEYAAYAEANSNHPIAKSIVNSYNKKINLEVIESYEEIPAQGIKMSYKGKRIYAGNEKLLKKENIEFSLADEIGTVVYIAVNNKYEGYILISDKLKMDSEKAITELRSCGVKEIVMLTGDNSKVSDKFASLLKIDTVFSNLLPLDKVTKLEELLKESNEKSKIMFVGDGINDAPVLARADIGVSMGALGSDAAIEASDIVLMTDEPSKIVQVIKIAKKTNKIVKQNIIIALSVKFIVLVLSTCGLSTMWEAIFADVGVSIIAVINAMRIMK